MLSHLRKPWFALVAAALLGLTALLWGAGFPAQPVQAQATVTTLASATMSADTAGVPPGSGAYTPLTGPVLTEGSAGDVGTGTIVLDAPAGFEFDTIAAVTVSTGGGGLTVDTPSCATPGTSSQPATVTATMITIEVCAASASPSSLTWSGIRVRPISGGLFDPDADATCGPGNSTPFPTGSITKSGTATIVGAPASYGVLTETSGAPATIVVTTFLPDGAVNTVVGPMTVCVEDQFSSGAVGAAMSWSISAAPIGATCQALVAPGATTDGTGKASTSLMLGHLNGNYEVSASSGAAGPTTDVSLASGGPGTSCAAPDLELDKGASLSSVPSGGTVTYTLTSSNVGTAPASGYFIDDFIPAGVTVTAATPSEGDCDQIAPFFDSSPPWVGPATISCDPFTTPAAGFDTVTLTATLTAAPGTILNGALTDSTGVVTESNEGAADPLNCTSVGEPFINPDPADTEPDNYDCLAITVTVGPDLEMTKSASSASVPSGGTVTYTLTSRNVGTAPASAYFIDDFIPAGVTVTAATPSEGDCDQIAPAADETPPWIGPATIRCGPFTTAAAGIDIVTLTATVTALPGTILNGARTDSTGVVTESNEGAADPLNCTSVGEPVTNPDPADTEPDNYDCLATTVTAGPDLELTKSASSATVATGGSVTYTLTSRNVGTTTASSYFIDDFVPAGVTVTAFTASDGADCDQTPFTENSPPWVGPTTIRCGPFTTPAGLTDTVTLTATVTATSGSVLNGARTDSTGVVTESNEDADDPDLVCTGEGSDLAPPTEPDNYDCLATTVTLKWDDDDCDGDVDIGDAQKIARWLINLSVSQTEPCPDIGSSVEVDSVFRLWGDTDCDGDVDIGDAQKKARFLINLPISQTQPCPLIGESVELG